MTFSIVAHAGSDWGVAVASKFLGVGALVPTAEAETGAIATQATANLAYRRDGLRLLREGRSAADTLQALTGADPGQADRQAGVVDRWGQAATYTGSGCHPWAGGVAGDGFAIQGNILTGPEVVRSMEQVWVDGDPSTPLAHRLLDVLSAGDEAGGDRRGRQSAALLVVRRDGGYGGGSDVAVDLRVDDHAAPVTELGRLLDLHDLYFGTPDPAMLLPLEGALADEVSVLLQRVGHPDLQSWAGVENYEMRLVEGRIDPLVLDKLRKAAAR